jgi:preprotein translocase subunit SecA
MARTSFDHCLPIPGPLWGAAPMRPIDDARFSAPRGWRWGGALAHARRVARQAAERITRWPAGPAAAPALRALRASLRRDGLTPDTQAQVLAAVAATAASTLGLRPYPSQLLAAAALLDGRMVEMATGEGKTLATALAACAGALAGLPVHVATANDYLAGRDAAALAPLAQALGLGVAHLAPALDADARRAVYQHDIVYATARELAFDHLRDTLALGPLLEPLARHAAQLAGAAPPPTLQRGLCLALLDEADSILLDEAEMPLVLSRPVAQPAQRAFWWQALALARQLAPDEHFTLRPEERHAALTPAGRLQLAVLARTLTGPWQRAHWREELMATTLVGLHLLQRNRHYLVRDDKLELLDEVTGRAAPGRVWSRGLHTVVELKEGLTPSPATETLARSSYQRFFQRYWRLAGLSGTVWEARAELAEVYRCAVVRVPLHRPCRRRHAPTRVFDDRDAMFHAVVRRARALQARGRPVLVGTDSVADADALSARLRSAGLPHRVLHALQDADEAATVAAAGRAGALTVATRMAGRGTDIALDDAARAAGGLHALSCQLNPSPRLDRQFAGRAARHGDPGSTESLLCRRLSADSGDHTAPTLAAWTSGHPALTLGPAWLAARLAGWALGWWQWRQEHHRRARRRQLQSQDRDGRRRLAFAGPDSG